LPGEETLKSCPETVGGTGVKITVDQKDLLKSLQGISAVVPTKTSLPILSTFLMETKGDGKVTLTANDLDVSLTNTLACETTGNGSVAVPGKKFFEIARSLPEDKVVIETEGDRISIKCRRSRFKMLGKSADEFPRLPAQKASVSFSIAASTLDRMINKTSYAVSTDLTRPSLCGVLWEIRKGVLSMIATDGHRLAKVELPGAAGSGDDKDVIVSPKALNIYRSLASELDAVNISLADNHITFDLGDSIIYSRLLEGPFPDYNQVMPKKNTRKLTVSRAELTDACRRVAILSSAITHQVKLVLEDDRLTLSVKTPDVGEAVEEVTCGYDAAKMEIGYNARYLLDILRTMDSDDVAFLLDRTDNAGVVLPEADSGEMKHQCLLMPLRLSD
jgi:DNA polymerase-3 subunit beta